MIDFLGVGLDRTGTTTLWKLLVQHQDISFPKRSFHVEAKHMAQQKGIHWFDWRHFDPLEKQRYESCWDHGKISGEICATYSKFADRVFTVYPEVKVILTWREPVERFISHLALLRSQLYEQKLSISLLAHIADPFNQNYEKTITQVTEFMSRYDYCTFPKSIENYFLHGETNPFIESILAIGHASQLEEWKSKSKHLLILPSTLLYNQQQTAVDLVLDFLGVEPMKISNTIHANSRPKITLSDETIQKIIDYYQT